MPGKRLRVRREVGEGEGDGGTGPRGGWVEEEGKRERGKRRKFTCQQVSEHSSSVVWYIQYVLLAEAELQEEKERMYEAIGYSENAEVPIYPKEVWNCRV